MKKISIYSVMTILLTAVIFFAACTKETSEVKLDPKLTTSQVLNIKSDSVNVVGFIVASGAGITERGICFNTSTGPTTANSKVIYTGETTVAAFTVKLKVTRLTKYFARAYAISGGTTVYGEEMVFTTPAALPTLAAILSPTLAVTADKGVTAATDINITDDGGPDATATISKRGVVYGLVSNPTIDSTASKIAHNKTIVTIEGTGKGTFSSLAAGLLGKTKYYFKAYATNSIGTSYSNEVSFTTPTAYATITTNATTYLTKTSGKLNGKFTHSGGGTVTERGFCYGLTADPTTIADTKVVVAGTDSLISADISDLVLGNTYHVRAYVINEIGTSYGADVSFAPLAYPTALYMVGDGVSASWNWVDNNLPMIPVNGTPNMFWKIVWLNATGGFKFSPQRDWGGDFGQAGDNTAKAEYMVGTANNLIVPGTAGYYMVVVDLLTGKISVTTPTVYLMGDVAGGWVTQNAAVKFTVDNANNVLTYTGTVSAGNLRMYASHPYFNTGDWWRSEFIIDGSALSFRGNGGDPIAVPVTAGTHTFNLNFKAGTAEIK